MIRFHCICGRPLKASDRLAGQKSRCPACAAAVVVPQPQRELVFAGHELPPDFLRDDSPEETFTASVPSTWMPCPQEDGDPDYVPTVLRQRGLRTRNVSLSWVKFVIILSGVQALLTGLGTALYPHVLHEGTSWMGGLVLAFGWSAAMGVLIGYGCNYLDSVLEYAVSGGARPISVPSRDCGPAIGSCLRWMLCFVSGPAVVFYLAVRYWIHCGDVSVVDGLILAELTAPAIGYWLLELLVLAERTGLAHASPVQVWKAMRRLGRRSVLATGGIAAAACIYVCVGTCAVILLHSEWLWGLLLLWLCWYSAWECGAFALRIVGFWYYASSTKTSFPSTVTA